MRNQGGKSAVTIGKPQDDSERFKVTSELIQYKIIKEINEMQRGGFTFGQVGGTAFSRVAIPMRLSNVKDYPEHDFIEMLGSNRFSDSDMENFAWEHGHFPSPKDTRVELLSVPVSPGTGPAKHVVRLDKAHYFQIDFKVEPLGSTGLGVLPKGVELAPELAAVCETFQLKVTMEAVFKKFTAGSSESSEYKEWANWLFARLQDELGD